jgi:hypothetical protein
VIPKGCSDEVVTKQVLYTVKEAVPLFNDRVEGLGFGV